VCNVTCAELLTETENTFLIGSTITFYLTVEINLSPVESGIFILHKDGVTLSRSNVNHTALDGKNVTYFLYDAQSADSGVYQAEHISTHAMLFTNRLNVSIINLNPSSIISQLPSSTSNSKLCS